MEALVLDYLRSLGLNPFSALYFRVGDTDILKLSFYEFHDLDRLKDILDYKYSSDRSGYTEFEKNNTVLLKGLLLLKLIKGIEEWSNKD